MNAAVPFSKQAPVQRIQPACTPLKCLFKLEVRYNQQSSTLAGCNTCACVQRLRYHCPMACCVWLAGSALLWLTVCSVLYFSVGACRTNFCSICKVERDAAEMYMAATHHNIVAAVEEFIARHMLSPADTPDPDTGALQPVRVYTSRACSIWHHRVGHECLSATCHAIAEPHVWQCLGSADAPTYGPGMITPQTQYTPVVKRLWPPPQLLCGTPAHFA